MRIQVRWLTVVAVVVAVGWCPSAYGQFLGDFSPDTTGVPIDTAAISQIFPGQHLADEFTLTSSSTITGGSIFSDSTFGALGDPVRIVILPDAAGVPGAVPVVDVTTTLDAVDGLFTTTQPTLTRKHATIPSPTLPAGTYWEATQ